MKGDYSGMGPLQLEWIGNMPLINTIDIEND
jgi:hypothetical protein